MCAFYVLQNTVGSVSVEFLNADSVPKGKLEEYRYLLSTGLPLPHFARTLLLPLCGLSTLF